MDSKIVKRDPHLSKVAYNPFETGPLSKAVPSTEAQREIWASIVMDANATLCYNESLAIDFEGHLNPDALNIAFQHLLMKHDSLRSVFSRDGKTFFIKEFSPVNINFLDYTNKNTQALETLKKAEVEFKYDLVNGPCFRTFLVKTAPFKFTFLFSAHHIVCDGWSFAVLLNELSEFYEAVSKNKKVQNISAHQFAEFAAEEYLNGIKLEHKVYWLKEFKKPLVTNPFPVDMKRPSFRTFNSARYDVAVNPELVVALKKLGALQGCSFYSTLMSVFNVFIYKLTKSQDIVVGMAAASQSGLDRNDLVGHLVNLLPLRMEIIENIPFNLFMKSVRSKMLDAFDHQFYSYGSLVKDLTHMTRDPAQMPLLNVVFNIDQQAPDQGLKFEGIKASYDTIPRSFENFEIFINAVSCGNKLILECQYNTNLFSLSTIENWFTNFLELMNQVVLHSAANISDLKLPYLKIPIAIAQEISKPIQNLMRNPQVEEKIKKIWAQVLLNDSLELEDNFFAVGGHSLLAIEVASLLETEFKQAFSIKDIFENPTILDLSHFVGSGLKTDAVNLPSVVASTLTSANVSHNQMQVWYLEEMHPLTLMHNLPASIRLKTKIDKNALEKTLHFLIERHPALRTAIVVENGVPVQKIQDKNLPKFKPELTLTKTSEENILDLLNREALIPFNKVEPPLFRAKLYELGTEDYVFFFMVHHAIWDGWSFDIFFEELNTVYSAYVKNEMPKSLKSSDISYVDYSVWLDNLITEKILNKQIHYWEEKLKGPLPILDLPLDYKRPLTISHEGATFPFTISKERATHYREYARVYGSSLFNVFLTAFKITLARYTGGDDIIVGLPVRGRGRPEIMQTIGYFVNTVALRSQVNLNQSFENILKHVSNTCLEAFDNQLVPFQIVLDKIHYQRDSTRTPVFQTFFSYQDVSNRSAELNGVPYTQINIDKNSTHTDLDLWIKASDKKIEGAFEFRKDLFKEISIERFTESFFHVLDSLIEHEEMPLNIAKALPAKHEEEIIKKWNNTWTNTKEFTPFHKIFEKNVKYNPHAIAIETSTEKISFIELNRLANRCANALIEKGVGRGHLVGISLLRNINLVASILGILKSGAGYVPLDPGFPQERLDYMIRSADPKILITEESLAPRFTHGGEKLLISDILSKEHFDKEVTNVNTELSDTIYVIYTSGSTGNPKGVELTHGSVTNFLLSMQEEIKIVTSDKILAVTTLSFDIAVLELFLPLISGGTIYLATSAETMDGASLKTILENKNISLMQATPSTWRLLLASGWKGHKKIKVLCGGEAFPIDLAKTLIPLVQEVWNMYGPTETTVWSSCKKLNLEDEFITVGRPIANTSLYILDDNHLMKPIGATGELFIGGHGLARGYFGRDDLTNERFMLDPFIPGGKMYATGDLARFTYNGEVECLGRNDGQVKVRGYRIELGEIEAQLQKLSGINEAAVITGEYRPGDVRIVAFLNSSNPLNERKMREELMKVLPNYMIPSHFKSIGELPKTLNGKIDKKVLLKMNAVEIDSQPKLANEEVSSMTTGEELGFNESMKNIWQSVLGINDLRDSDNFFNIGGNSLLAVQMYARIFEEFKVSLPLSLLIESANFGLFKKNVFSKFFESRQVASFHTQSMPSNLKIYKSLVTIDSSGSKNPLYCFHAAGGNVITYVDLIPATKNIRPLMAFQSVGLLDGRDIPLKTIPEMATSYIKEMKMVQPKGPYLISGWSMGGLIAFEVALQLQKAGEEVEELILFDTFGPDHGVMTEFDYRDHRSFKQKITDKVKTIFYRIQIKWSRRLGVAPPFKALLHDVEIHNFQAIWKYRPVEKYQGTLHLLRDGRSDSGWYSDPNMRWRNLVVGEIRPYSVPAIHEKFVENPEVIKILSKFI